MQAAALASTAHKTTATVAVELLLDRKNHKDNLYGTEIVWFGKGDVKLVPEPLWPSFARHQDVYALSDKRPTAAPAITQVGAAAAARAPTAEEIAAYLAAHPELLQALVKTAAAPPANPQPAAPPAAPAAPTMAEAQANLRRAIAKGGFHPDDTDAVVRAMAAEAGIKDSIDAALTGAPLRAMVVELAKQP